MIFDTRTLTVDARGCLAIGQSLRELAVERQVLGPFVHSLVEGDAAVREDGSTAESFDYDDRDNVVEMTDGSGSTTLATTR